MMGFGLLHELSGIGLFFVGLVGVGALSGSAGPQLEEVKCGLSRR